MQLEVTHAHFIGDYKVLLKFSNGMEGTADLAPFILNEAPPPFAPLRDVRAFADFAVAHGTLTWPNDLDLAAEYLFFTAFKGHQEFQHQFVSWGYITPTT